MQCTMTGGASCERVHPLVLLDHLNIRRFAKSHYEIRRGPQDLFPVEGAILPAMASWRLMKSRFPWQPQETVCPYFTF